jgi:hypothetical protein
MTKDMSFPARRGSGNLDFSSLEEKKRPAEGMWVAVGDMDMS